MTPDRPLTSAESRALDAIESGFVFEHRTRRRRQRIAVLVSAVVALAIVAVLAPPAALTLGAAIALAFAGPLVVSVWLRILRVDDSRVPANRRLTGGRLPRRR